LEVSLGGHDLGDLGHIIMGGVGPHSLGMLHNLGRDVVGGMGGIGLCSLGMLLGRTSWVAQILGIKVLEHSTSWVAQVRK